MRITYQNLKSITYNGIASVLLNAGVGLLRGKNSEFRLSRAVARRKDFHPMAKIMLSATMVGNTTSMPVNKLNLELIESSFPQLDVRGTEDFNDIQAFCCFVGYQRSGHTLMGSLLDAHPDIVISNELNVAESFDEVSGRDDLFQMIIENSRNFATLGRIWNGFDYQVKGQWQGRYRTLRIVGDKRGAGVTNSVIRDPKALDKLQDWLGLPLRIIHIYRNPFDNIARISIARNRTVEEAINSYFRLANGVKSVKEIRGDDIIEMSNESIISAPEEKIRELCLFLGVEPHEDYLRSCADRVWNSPHRSRDSVEWTPELIELVARKMDDYPWYAEYPREP